MPNLTTKKSLFAIVTVFTVASLLLTSFTNSAFAEKDNDHTPTPTPTATPVGTHVIVCHKDGKSGNFSRIDVSVHSVDDANGLSGHGDHGNDIWSPYTYNGTDYSGQGNYSGTNFDTCSPLATATPTPSPSASPSPSPTPTIPSFDFPSCQSVLPKAGDVAHYLTGLHQIVGGPLLSGSDDVYSLESGNYLQCFCPATGNSGIQTNWLRSNEQLAGWFFEWGAQWNLGNYNYAAQNLNFTCGESTPTPTPTPTPEDPCTDNPEECVTPTPTPFDYCPNLPGIQTGLPGPDWYRLDGPSFECRQFQYGGPESAHQEGSGAVQGISLHPQVLGASTMAGTGSFEESFYQVIMSIGATLSAFGIKGFKKVNKKK